MAAEFIVVNPRGRKRRKSRARRASTHRRRRAASRRHNPARGLFKRRRRRAVSRRRHSRRRTHRNPSMMGRGTMKVLTTGVGIGAGAIGVNLAAGWLSKHLPAQLQSGIGNTAVKAGIGLVALPMLLKFVPGGKRFVAPLMVGAGVAVAFDLWTLYAEAPVRKALGLSDYQPGYLAAYEPGTLQGMEDGDLSGSAYGGGVYD